MSRVFVTALALALLAAATVNVVLSSASFTTTSATTLQVSTSLLTDDRMESYAGDGQTAVVDHTVATAPSVLVEDGHGNPVSGIAVTFSVTSGGGTVTGGTSVTDSSGIAAVGSWKLGTSAGANTLRASAAGLPGEAVSFSATAVAGPVARCQVIAGTYAPVAGSDVTITARLADEFGNPILTPGIGVTFSLAGEGTLVGANPAVTDDAGAATITLTTSTVAGRVATVRAESPSPAVSGVTAPITTVAGGADRIAATGGDGQSATVGTAVAVVPSVRVTDVHGNPVAGVTVTFAVASGGGSVTGATATTGASGIAAVGSWTLGTIAGANTLTATSAGLSGSPLTFTATGLAGEATRYVVTSSSYNPSAGTTVTMTAQLSDGYGNAVPTSGSSVAWTKSNTGGSFGANPTVTNASGMATTTFRTSSTSGVVATVTATSTGITGTSAAITTRTASRLALSAGDGQSAIAGALVALAPSVLVTDAGGNPVSGIVVTFSVVSGGGSITGGSATTNASGIASVGSWRLGATAGTNRLRATRSGLTGSPLTFTATGVAGPASKIVVNAGNAQSATVNTAVTTAPSVKVTDGNNNPVAGVTVTFAVASGGGSVTGATATTGASGIAAVGSWTLGTIAGANTLTATSAGLSGSPLTFTATGLAGAATRYVVTSSSYNPVAGAAVIVTAQLADVWNNPVKTSGISVTWSKTGSGGTFSANPTTTNTNGIATVTFTTGPTLGTVYLITASSTGRTGTSPAITTR